MMTSIALVARRLAKMTATPAVSAPFIAVSLSPKSADLTKAPSEDDAASTECFYLDFNLNAASMPVVTLTLERGWRACL